MLDVKPSGPRDRGNWGCTILWPNPSRVRDREYVLGEAKFHRPPGPTSNLVHTPGPRCPAMALTLSAWVTWVAGGLDVDAR